MEERLDQMEKSISQLGDALSTYSRETKQTLMDRFSAIDDKLAKQSQINSDLHTSLDQVGTQISQLEVQKDEEHKKESKRESDNECEKDRGKDEEKKKYRELRERFEKTRDERESDSQSEEEEKDRYASKPDPSTRHASMHLSDAYKHKLILCDPLKPGWWRGGSLAY